MHIGLRGLCPRKMSQKNQSTQQGITLIALIVTIIVLLILAAVTINLLIRENGLIEKAKQATDKYLQEANNEVNTLESTAIDILNIVENNPENHSLIESGKYNQQENKVYSTDLIKGVNALPVKNSDYYCELVINDKENIKYALHVITYKGNLYLDGQEKNIKGITLSVEEENSIYEIGDATTDCATAAATISDGIVQNYNTESMAKNMVVLKIDGNLTIGENVKLTTCKNSNGYGGPKGFCVFVNGKLVNEGNISMTQRGAYAQGEDVYLWKNSDDTYEYVPAQGAQGGNVYTYYSKNGSRTGNAGYPGTGRQTGGGGTGGTTVGDEGGYSYVHAGGTGTSYSGGTGSGGINQNSMAGPTYNRPAILYGGMGGVRTSL